MPGSRGGVRTGRPLFRCMGAMGASGPGLPLSPRHPPSAPRQPRLSSRRTALVCLSPGRRPPGEAVAVPRPGSPLAAQALSRSPLKTGRTRLGACGLLESAGSRGRGCAARGVGALLLTRPEGQSMHSLSWSSHVHICSGILRKRGCGCHAWCQALGEAGLCVHTQSPGELMEPAEPTPRFQALERRMVQSSSTSVRLTRRAAGSLFGTV